MSHPLPRGAVLLEAGAGTGKTWHLADLAVRLVAEEGVPVERMLVVTSTEAARAALRGRIRERLRAAGTPAARAALADFDEAPVFTLQGFCAHVLARQAFECGAAFGGPALDPLRPQAEALAADFWVRETWQAPAVVYPQLGALDAEARVDLALRVAREPELPLAPPPPAAEAPDLAGWHAAAFAAADAWRAGGPDAAAQVDAARLSGYTPAYTRRFVVELDAWCAAEPRLSPQLPLAVQYFAAGTLAWHAGGARAPAHPVFDAMQRLLDVHAAVGEAVQVWPALLPYRLADWVRAERPRRGVRCHDDLVRALHAALGHPRRGPSLRAALRSCYAVALVDEVQDADPLQWAMLRAVFGDAERPLYLAGDPRQAIHGFRGADLDAYFAARRDVEPWPAPLPHNHRTDPPLAAALDRLFARLPDGFGAGAPPARGAAVLTDAGAALEVRLVPRGVVPQRSNGRLDPARAVEPVAALVAADIARFLGSEARIDGRPPGPGDVAVLVRSHAQAAAVQAALRAAGVPSAMRGAGSVFATDEAAALARILRAVLEPASPGAVRSALTTDLIGVRAAQIVALSHDDAGWSGWIERLRAWRALWIEHGFVHLFRAVLEERDVRVRLLRRPDGERRLTDLLHLGELLHEEEVRARRRPAGLLGWLEAGGPTLTEEQREVRPERDGDAVRIATIHAGKGLEHGAVWCPFLWEASALRSKDARHLRWRDPAAGPRLDVRPPAEKPAALRAATEARRAEDLRLCYVALTRARHRCTVYFGAFEGAERSPLARLLGDPPLGTDDALLAALDALARPGELGVSWVDPTPAVWHPPVDARPLAVRPFGRPPLDGGWRRTSFSGLTRDAEHEGPAGDEADAEPGEGPVAADALVPLHDLPGGTRFGTFLHRVLELHDFQAPAELPGRVAAELALYGFSLDAARLAAALQGVIDTPLDAAGLRLADVPRDRRLDELDFFLPTGGGFAGDPGHPAADPARLAAVLRAHGGPGLPPDYPDRLANLAFAPLRGFLNGSIDLVFEHEGRWYLADYKSNRLGERFGDYAAPALRAEMSRSHYVLQYHLYAVALHRYLRHRLRGAYDPARHFGGVLYLFLRGMTPATGPASGVFFDCPPPALLEALSAALEGEG